METQRCPMCGQANPPHQEVCQYCQARLKPLWIDSSQEAESSIEERTPKSKTPIEADEPLVPDWLRASRSQMGGEDTLQGEELREEGELFSEELLESGDILSDLFSEEPSAEEGEQDVPQWLRSLRGDSVVKEGTPPREEAADFEQPLPFWLDYDESSAEKTLTEASFSEQQLPPFTEVPFEGLDLQSELSAEAESGEQEFFTGEELPVVPPFELTEPFLFQEQPSSVEDEFAVSKAPEAEKEEAITESVSAPLEEGDWINELPSWLDALPGQEWVEGQESKEELPPEFLQGVVPPFEETEAELSEIEFPAWLDEAQRSMEPELDTVIESLTAGAIEVPLEEPEEEPRIYATDVPPEKVAGEEIPVEIAGPLHGLRGVLPAEPLIAEQKKPSKALSELLITDKQRAQAELFLKLIEEEGKPSSLPPSRQAKPNTLWRVLIFLALFAAATVSLLFRPFSSIPQELSVGVFDAMQAVAQLSPESTVLMIVDIEGGDFAEMQATVNAMVDQMMIKGAFFVLVSANQNGTLQADRLLREVNRINGHNYQAGSGWVNLGFLPGGMAGMQAFAQSLSVILPNTIDGEAAWQHDRLKNVRSLSDFSLIVVVTEDSTRARQWVEQLKGWVEASQLVFAVSAQVEPVMRPYYESDPRQIQSVLAGIRDGAIYETQLARQGWAMQLWDAYTLVVFVGVVLILGGSMVYALSALFRRAKPQSEGKS